MSRLLLIAVLKSVLSATEIKRTVLYAVGLDVTFLPQLISLKLTGLGCYEFQ